MEKRRRYKQGDKFNYWTLIEYQKQHKQWLASCVCGKEKLVWISHLTKGKSISCSCISRTTHGLTKSQEYNSWSSAKYRCTNPNNDRYKDYGGRGIKMCDRWINSFENFLLDMGKRPDNTSIDRIDTDGDYEPSNCKWSTNKEQSNNLRIHKQSGLGLSLNQLSLDNNIPYGRLQSRVYRGWDIKEALSTESCQGRKPELHGQIFTLSSRNKSGVRGVHWNKVSKRWVAQIKENKKIVSLGSFKNLEDATEAVLNKRKQMAVLAGELLK